MKSALLEDVKEIVSKMYDEGDCGIFNTKNVVGDPMTIVLDEICGGRRVQVFICYDWAYFEVFGLTNEEFIELVDFYDSLGKNRAVFVQNSD